MKWIRVAETTGQLTFPQFDDWCNNGGDKDDDGGDEFHPIKAFIEDEAVSQKRIYYIDVADQGNEARTVGLERDRPSVDLKRVKQHRCHHQSINFLAVIEKLDAVAGTCIADSEVDAHCNACKYYAECTVPEHDDAGVYALESTI